MKNLKIKNLIEDQDQNLRLSQIIELNQNKITQLEPNETIKENLLGLNLFDVNKQEIFQGDIVKVKYQDRNSTIFQNMKENNDEEIFFVILPADDFLITGLISSDYEKYFTTPINDSTTFLRYLSGINALEIVSNYYLDKDFYTKHFKDEEYYKQKERDEYILELSKKIPHLFNLKILENNLNEICEDKNYTKGFKSPKASLKAVYFSISEEAEKLNLESGSSLRFNINISFDIDYDSIDFNFSEEDRLNIYKNMLGDLKQILMKNENGKSRGEIKLINNQGETLGRICKDNFYYDRFYAINELPEEFLFSSIYYLYN